MVNLNYDLTNGSFSFKEDKLWSIENCFSAFKDEAGSIIRSLDFKQHKVIEEKLVRDKFGEGKKVVVLSYNDDSFELKQNFYIYNEGFVLLQTEVYSDKEFKTNYMAPLISEEDIKLNLQNTRALFVPFDNDKWARFISYPVKYSVESYELTAIYDEKLQNGLVTGAINHDEWKTGIKVEGDTNTVTAIKIYGGAASEQTRDVLPHGYISGNTIKSPLIFLGYFDNYRQGFEKFGKLNSIIRPALKWTGGVPFGWNSWAALMTTLTSEKYIEASDFIKNNVQNSFNNDSIVYLNFDAFWSTFTPEKLKEAIGHAESNGQRMGIYGAPFVTFKGSFEEVVEGTGGKYKYKDLLLKDCQGNILPPVDGLYSLDPTHPGTIMKIEHETNIFIELGAFYVKADFLGHAAREGNFYNKNISTGIQAYNYAMKHFVDCLSPEKAGRDIFISLSIAPILPHGYGHGRRICCDAFGTIDQSEYLLNSLSYLWWMNDCLYRFNDPDHIVLYKTYDKVASTENEALTRFNAAAICGTVMLNSDDYSYEGARERAKKILTNDEVNQIARKGETFKPFSGNTGDKAADIFMKDESEVIYLGLFNYSIFDEKDFCIDLVSLGFDRNKVYKVKDLWTKEESSVDNNFSITLPPAASTIIRINKK